MQSNFVAPHIAQTKVPEINVTDTKNEIIVRFQDTNLQAIRATCDVQNEEVHIDLLSKTAIRKFYKRGHGSFYTLMPGKQVNGHHEKRLISGFNNDVGDDLTHYFAMGQSSKINADGLLFNYTFSVEDSDRAIDWRNNCIHAIEGKRKAAADAKRQAHLKAEQAKSDKEAAYFLTAKGKREKQRRTNFCTQKANSYSRAYGGHVEGKLDFRFGGLYDKADVCAFVMAQPDALRGTSTRYHVVLVLVEQEKRILRDRASRMR